ncbi:hypothetical protein [Microbacterium sp. KR10-403]|uniref:hypothetical protein n=1 Tax=Microbacterium sp. KR10-403 TaxID=3158581 RepID=UPI0032E51B94
MSTYPQRDKYWLDGTGTSNEHDNAPKPGALSRHAYYIYLTVNELTGSLYVGMHRSNPQEAWRAYMGSGTYLKTEARGYGVKNFSKKLLAYAEDGLEAKFLEARFIAKALRKGVHCYNSNQSEAVQRDCRDNLSQFAFKASFRGRQRLQYNLTLTEKAIAAGLDTAEHDDLTELRDGWKLALQLKDERYAATKRLDPKDWAEDKYGFDADDSKD